MTTQWSISRKYLWQNMRKHSSLFDLLFSIEMALWLAGLLLWALLCIIWWWGSFEMRKRLLPNALFRIFQIKCWLAEQEKLSQPNLTNKFSHHIYRIIRFSGDNQKFKLLCHYFFISLFLLQISNWDCIQ